MTGFPHDNKQVSVDFNPCSKLLRLNWTFDPDGIPVDWVTDDGGSGSDGSDDGEEKAASLTGLDSRTKGV
ncbi:hypothetical protein HZH66_013328 [Vespula vulgaris]|uniref:Uncharacterized protein n=1 Tax=Vespula vulgaris TaxID=7454 RepID=A0A834J6Q0_VESVU|nr:hypothetical protein HZH66_013328 [Vespula vulgaris]